MKNPSPLPNVKGEDIAYEFNAYGISVVGADPAGVVQGRPLPPFQRFIDRHAVTKDTPIVLLARGAVMVAEAAAPPVGPLSIGEILATGWRYMPGEAVEPGTIHEAMVHRLKAGLPVTLIPQTANALRLDADDLLAIEFNRLERALLTRTVWRQRLPGAEPVLVMADFADGQRRKPIWWPSLARYRATHRFASINRGVLRWADER